MENVIIIIILLAIIVGIVFYLIRAKKRGDNCIGCPYSKECNGGCGCGSREQDKKED